MPWTLHNPPAVAKNWSEDEQRKCVAAANAVLESAGSDEEAIFACISAAGRSENRRANMTRMEGVQIFAVGRWNGLEFTVDDLESIARNFKVLQEVHRVPLKMGHNDEQPFTDGQPALGWVTDVRVDGMKLVADFSDVPPIVAEAISANLYRQISIELEFGAVHKGQDYDQILSGVALLGADLPAVNTLDDLNHYLPRDAKLNAKRRQVFTIGSNLEDGTMNVEEQLNELKGQLSQFSKKQEKLEAENETLRKENTDLKDSAAKFERERIERENAEKKARVETARKAVITKLDDAVKDKRITPAQREAFGRALGVDDDERVLSINDEDITSMVGEPKKRVLEGEHAANGNEDDGMQRADVRLSRRARMFAREHKVDFATALNEVLQDDPALAAEYKDMHNELSRLN